MEFEKRHKEKSALERLQSFRLGDIQQGPRDRDRMETILTSSPVFVVGDSFYRSRIPKSTHWSVAWSDLMMTMFILFLSLFVYQVAQREFLSEDNVEVVSGRSMDLAAADKPSFPIVPIAPDISGKRGDALKRTEPVEVIDKAKESVPAAKRIDVTIRESDSGAEARKSPPGQSPSGNVRKKDDPMNSVARNQDAYPAFPPAMLQPFPADTAPVTDDAPPPQEMQEHKTQQSPAGEEQQHGKKDEIIAELYDLSRYTLLSEKLEKFASVELVPDKAVRIILTGDLLFATGQAELTDSARESLSKLTEILKKTPYTINVNGHTDNIPMHSDRFPSNWELSVARASRVARYLIRETGLPGSRFRVSGFSFFRPVKPNTNARNRAANRRVEIVISREPQSPQP